MGWGMGGLGLTGGGVRLGGEGGGGVMGRGGGWGILDMGVLGDVICRLGRVVEAQSCAKIGVTSELWRARWDVLL